MPLKIDAARLWSTLVETAHFGATAAGGLGRVALSPADGQVRAWLVDQVQRAGYETAVDAIGNMYAMRPGTDPTRLPVAIGSHLDTQPAGGRFDGVLGVLAGLEVLRTLDEAGVRTAAPLCLVNWTNEEGARFPPAEMGSLVYAGRLPLAEAYARTDAQGVRVGDALAAIGYVGAETPGARRFAALLELHIEQGPVLQDAGLRIGVVTGAKGIFWCDGLVSGMAGHAGTNPMTLRRDALTAFAAFALEVEVIARTEAPDGVGTIGVADIRPGSRNTVPGAVGFTLEFRHPDAKRLQDMRDSATDAADRIARERGVSFAFTPVWDEPPVTFAAAPIAAIRAAAAACGAACLEMTSGAGHDACAIAAVAQAAMIFVPCKNGISHDEAESATPEDCALGAEVLMHAVLQLAQAQ